MGRQLFVKGDSGNPRGRPKGKKNAITQMQQELIEHFAGQLTRKTRGEDGNKFHQVVATVIDKAIKGDMQAAKLLLDRAIPARKSVEHFGTQEAMGGVNIFITGTTNGKALVETTTVVEGEFSEAVESADEEAETPSK